MRPRSLVWAILLLLLAWSPAAQAQEDIVAFGDSITQGPQPFDEEGKGGYPSRLQELLRASGRPEVKVFNEGLSGETTSAGLSRIQSILNSRSGIEIYIIMEGTNDVSRVARGELSLETTVNNLESMAARVRADAIIALYATIIPRPSWARLDRNNAISFDLVRRLRDLSSGGARPRAEPYEFFENEGATSFKKLYFCCDPVGHPNAAGFDFLAQIFADRIQEIDNLAPTISLFTKTGSGTSLQAGDRLHAEVHESGSDIRSSETYFTLNGRVVSTDVTGSKRRVELDYQVSAREIDCGARITVRTEDTADPPNIRNRTMAELGVPNASLLKGDVNGDCRVDGLDLGLLGISFGARFGEVLYAAFADTNNDGRIDGDDLAKLARNFGKTSDS